MLLTNETVEKKDSSNSRARGNVENEVSAIESTSSLVLELLKNNPGRWEAVEEIVDSCKTMIFFHRIHSFFTGIVEE